MYGSTGNIKSICHGKIVEKIVVLYTNSWIKNGNYKPDSKKIENNFHENVSLGYANSYKDLIKGNFKREIKNG